MTHEQKDIWMKIRTQAADFRVEEINSIPIGRDGNYGVYEMRKTGWNTLDALKSIAIQWKRSPKELAHAGLKDRHAITSQVITIFDGPSRNFEDHQVALEYLGQSTRATVATDIVANRFSLVLRSLSSDEVNSAKKALPQIAATGLANYFDDQRFGSWIPGHPFIAEHWIRADYEEALRLSFAEPHPMDDGDEREQKDILRKHWGDWKLCKQKLSRSHRRSIITFLDDRKDDFKGAWACVNAEMRGLYLTAFQSDLWNHILNNFFQETFTDDQLIRFRMKTGELCLPTTMTAEQKQRLHSAEIPLPSARIKNLDESLRPLVEKSLAEKGWKLEELKVRHPRDRFFPKASRAAMIPVADLESEFGEDELSPGLAKLNVQFTLPRGCYATMLVKRLMIAESQTQN